MTVAIAMSGGVDSAVAASILAARYRNIVGVTFLTGFESDPDATSKNAASAAAAIGIEHHTVDVSAPFRSRVIDLCQAEYAAGRTPNPCAICNPVIKFGVLRDFAFELGAERFATGHYARIVLTPDGAPALARGQDPTRDQSYFLYRLTGEVLETVDFPLGDIHKSEVRKIARELGFASADQKESQDVCFVARDSSLSSALRSITGRTGAPGRILNGDNREIGRHDGIDAFTIGQRRGLGIAVGRRAWVSRIEECGDVFLTTDVAELNSSSATIHDVVVNPRVPVTTDNLSCKVRYAHGATPCEISALDDDQMKIHFDKPIKAVTPGQAGVVYSGDLVYAGGWLR